MNRQLTLLLQHTIIRMCMEGAQPRRNAYQFERCLLVEEEKLVVQFYLVLGDLGYPLRVSIVKAFASAILLCKPGFLDPQLGGN